MSDKSLREEITSIKKKVRNLQCNKNSSSGGDTGSIISKLNP